MDKSRVRQFQCQTCGSTEEWLHPANERCLDLWHLPKAMGVGRIADNEQAILVHFGRRPSDDDLRHLHEVLSGRVARSETQRFNEEQQAMVENTMDANVVHGGRPMTMREIIEAEEPSHGDKQSETPRTDEEVEIAKKYPGTAHGLWVSAEHARQLERELAAAKYNESVFRALHLDSEKRLEASITPSHAAPVGEALYWSARPRYTFDEWYNLNDMPADVRDVARFAWAAALENLPITPSHAALVEQMDVALIIAHALDESLEPRNRLQGVVARLHQLRSAEITEGMVDRALEAAKGVLVDTRRFWTEQDRAAVRAMLETTFLPSATRESGALPLRRWLNEAIGFLGLEGTIKPVTPYGSAGEMIEHVVSKARDLSSTTESGMKEKP